MQLQGLYKGPYIFVPKMALCGELSPRCIMQTFDYKFAPWARVAHYSLTLMCPLTRG